MPARCARNCDPNDPPPLDPKTVGKLVGVNADEPGTDLIDRPEKLVLRNFGEVWEGLLKQGIEEIPEGFSAANAVFPKSRLTLVHAAGDTAAKNVTVEVRADAQLIESVSHLVDDAEKTICQIFTSGTGGDTDITAGKPGHKRMR